jgi:dihydroflavonol-4-reductase
MGASNLVVGANGFLGSHVARQLATAGVDTRAMVRPGADTRSIDDLDMKRFDGDIFDTETLRKAMDGCDDVYYCVVDTRAWLRDPAPLFRTNVEGLRNVLEVAARAELRRFVFTSSYVTIGRRHHHVATEADTIDRPQLNPYVESRVRAEDMVMQYAVQGLPAVAMCVSTTYGDGDWGATPHGALIAKTVRRELPAMINDIEQEVVGIDDAARALILAADYGHNGQRYIISERMMQVKEVVRIAADEAGVPPPRWSIPARFLYGIGALVSLKVRITGKDDEYSLSSLRLLKAEAPLDNRKAIHELHWQPRPVQESIREAARFWMTNPRPIRGSR